MQRIERLHARLRESARPLLNCVRQTNENSGFSQYLVPVLASAELRGTPNLKDQHL